MSHQDTEVIARIEAVFADAGARGFLHAHEIGADDGPEVSAGADEPVVLASVFKIVVAVAFARAVEAGRLEETETATVGPRYRIGGIGTAGCADDVRMSLRDLALFMLTMSDNAATDVIYHRLGPAAVDQVLTDLKLANTRIIGCCEDLFRTIAEDLGGDLNDLDATLAATTEEQILRLAVLDPARTSASTPREIGALLDAIWTDRAATPAACERVRNIMAHQIWPHRLSSGFTPDVTIAAKTGTLPAVRNECGVVTFPDGRRYAVAVFTRAASLAERQPAVDAAIGHAARIAVDHLRATVAAPSHHGVAR
ncbi:serine hydrolase [Microtetraspora sp. NBRC 13810]|uniref:serine hydrolase n=1 Tax=Microtetraspora sp. NBRC 13810 TaxID=3030990 RepID=UPI0024A4878D|nr:serine hydrolase [Microtetraspora sp. NBRC 13810]GLW13078.1 serine hydrolase [Microtetraspora sp. NBRC 13810]